MHKKNNASGETKHYELIEFSKWTSELDDILECIPEDEDYPHALIKILASHQTRRRKRIWLISTGDHPVALAPLKKMTTLIWRPVTQYILPGIVIPSKRGEVFNALEALHKDVEVALWRTDCGLPDGGSTRRLTKTTTHAMRCSDDFEAYWKSTNVWKDLRRAANKWKHLTLETNATGAHEWIIRNWGKKWGVPEDEVQDRIAAANFLQPRGKHFSLTLHDDGRAIAGQTCIVHRGDIVGQCLHRENESSSVGNRLIHLTFCWAAERGFRHIDIGGGHNYKRKFAPPLGARYECQIAPFTTHLADKALSAIWAGLSHMRLVTNSLHSSTN